MEIAMNSYKNILKRICKYVGYIILFLCSSVIIGIVAGISFYVFVDKDCDSQFVQGCMATGMSEQSCKDMLY